MTVVKYEFDPPVHGGALYRKQGFRGRWRLETAGTKWITFRSVEVMGARGYWATHRERTEDWPNGWDLA